MEIVFKWTDDMSVGEPVIDRQHQKLLEQVNKVMDAMIFGAGSKEVKEALDFFGDYIRDHFSYEENYMKNGAYPDFEEHKKEHQDFEKNYNDFRKRFIDGADAQLLVVDIEKFLGEWWVSHIGHEDKMYANYFNS